MNILQIIFCCCCYVQWCDRKDKNKSIDGSADELFPVQSGRKAVSYSGRLFTLLPPAQSLLEGPDGENESLWSQHSHCVGLKRTITLNDEETFSNQTVYLAVMCHGLFISQRKENYISREALI